MGSARARGGRWREAANLFIAWNSTHDAISSAAEMPRMETQAQIGAQQILHFEEMMKRAIVLPK